MSALVGAELLKLRTTRAWIGFVLAVMALSGIASAGTVGSAAGIDLGTSELSRDILSSALFAVLTRSAPPMSLRRSTSIWSAAFRARVRPSRSAKRINRFLPAPFAGVSLA